jgi:hypothetical protein
VAQIYKIFRMAKRQDAYLWFEVSRMVLLYKIRKFMAVTGNFLTAGCICSVIA